MAEQKGSTELSLCQERYGAFGMPWSSENDFAIDCDARGTFTALVMINDAARR